MQVMKDFERIFNSVEYSCKVNPAWLSVLKMTLENIRNLEK